MRHDATLREMKVPAIAELPESTEATNLVDVVAYFENHIPGLEGYGRRLSRRYKDMVERAEHPREAGDQGAKDAITQELRDWIALVKKIEQAWLKPGTPGEPARWHDLKDTSQLPATFEERLLYEGIYKAVELMHRTAPFKLPTGTGGFVSSEQDLKKIQAMMDAKFTGEDLNSNEVYDRLGMHYREEGELEYFMKVYRVADTRKRSVA